MPWTGRSGNQYRSNWPKTEHDGLLGSGGFPRPSGYAGQLPSKDHGTVPQQNRTSERSQAPHPYKVGACLPVPCLPFIILESAIFGIFLSTSHINDRLLISHGKILTQ